VTGATWQGIVLIAYGALVISSVDQPDLIGVARYDVGDGGRISRRSRS
jgi:hypothetical protein